MEQKRPYSRGLFLGLAVGLGILVTLALLTGMALAKGPASPTQQDIGIQATTGVITGRVTAGSPTGLPIANVQVRFFDNLTQEWVYTATTNTEGYYSATVTADSDAVRVYFTSTYCVDEYYNNKSTFGSANAVALSATQPVTGINAALTQLSFGSLTGIVTDATTTNPLSNVTVSLYDASTHTGLNSAQTGAGGIYTFTNLAADAYKVRFSRQGYAMQYYAYTSTITQATVVTVGIGQAISNVNAALGPGNGCITGVVKADSTQTSLSGVTVTVYTPMSAFIPMTETTAVTVTDTAGYYRICGLGGDYLVGFRKMYYIPQWYDEQASMATANRITVTNQQTTTNVDGQLILGGCVSGKVQDTGGITRPGAVITVLNIYGQAVGAHISPPPLSQDTFIVCELPTGSYTILCSDSGLDGSTTALVTATQATSDTVCTVADFLFSYSPLIYKND